MQEIEGLLLDDQGSHINSRSHYGRNVFEEVAKFASRVLRRYARADFDIIHAHDDNGFAVAQIAKKYGVICRVR